MVSSELGMTVTAVVSLGAGLVRGFTGFGGPAFMLAILTIFYTPVAIIGKILVVDLSSSFYLFFQCFRQIDWKSTACLSIPTIIMMPLGQWLLVELEPSLVRRLIASIILLSCAIMLCGFRYKKPLNAPAMMLVGAIAGVVFGGTYIALIVVVAILLGPYDKNISRTLIISWAFIVSIWYGVISIASGTTGVSDLIVAWPGAVLYFIGVWFGSRWFKKTAETRYRNVALITLLMLSFLSFLN